MQNNSENNTKLIHRLDEYIVKKGLSFNKLAIELGLSNSYFSKMVKNAGSVGSDVIEKILRTHPDLSAEWLLVGRGEMLTTDTPALNHEGKGVPYYNVDFCGGFDIVFNDQTQVPDGYIFFPQYNKADSWANITGNSMEPLISNGDIIALKWLPDWHDYLLYGEVYGIMTEKYRTVKRVRKSSKADHILLVPENKNEYDIQEIPKRIITGVWQVLGCAKKIF